MIIILSIALAYIVGCLAVWGVLTHVEDTDPATPSHFHLTIAWPIILIGAIVANIFESKDV